MKVVFVFLFLFFANVVTSVSAVFPDHILAHILSHVPLETARQVNHRWKRIGNDWYVCKQQLRQSGLDVDSHIFQHWNQPNNDNWCDVYNAFKQSKTLVHKNIAHIVQDASIRGHTRVIQLMLNHLNEYQVKTTFLDASILGHFDIAKLLVKYISNKVVLKTALHNASVNGHVAIVNLLLPYI